MKLNALRILVSALVAMVSAQRAFAHGGQIEAGGGGSGPVTLSQVQQASIGLKTSPADMQNIDSVLVLNGKVELNPNLHAHVTSRIEGRVEELYAQVGDKVEKGQKLAEIQSRQIGDPPPVAIVESPLSGVINDRAITVGDSVEPSKELFHVINLSEVIVVAEVYEEDVGKVNLGQKARVQLLGYPGETFEGKATFIGLELDPERRTLPVWITVQNPQGKLRPAMFAKIAIVLAQHEGVLAVPKEAILEEGGEKFVFVQTGNVFTRMDVQTDVEDDRFAEIADGLVPGDLVVIDGKREVYTQWLTGGAKPADKD